MGGVEGLMIWWIADTHFSHANIVRGVSKWLDTSGCRPFLSIQDHDDWLVNLINASVKADDTLYHLGDWSFGGISKLGEFRSRLACQDVHLIYGNHDHHAQQREECWGLFSSRQQYLEKSFGDVSIVMMHYPLESWNNMERGSIHLHGHVHGKSCFIQGRIDVGVDAHGLLSLDELRLLPKATNQRHRFIEGGNKFG